MKKIYLILIIGIMLITNISAMMPKFSHKWVHDRALAEPQSHEFYQSCVNNKDLCYTGNVLTDISVIYYYTGRDKYSATHLPSFCRGLWENVNEIPNTNIEEMKACAIGGCMHQPPDIVSHNEMVPETILQSKIINFIIHVFTEQKLDNWVEEQDPELDEDAIASLKSFEICKPLFIKTMSEDPAYVGSEDLNSLYDTFITEIEGSITGYDRGFKSKSFFVTLKSVPTSITTIYIIIMSTFILISLLLILKLYKRDRRFRVWITLLVFLPIALILIYLFWGALQGTTFNSFIKLIKPMSNLVPMEKAPEYYIDKSTDESIRLLSQGPGFLENTEADGFTALDYADKKVIFFDYLILIILLGLLSLMVWWVFKKNKLKSPIGWNL